MRGERFPRGVLQCQMHPTFRSCLLKIWPRFTGWCQNTSATLTREWNTAATWASSVLLGEQKRKEYLSSGRSNLRNTYCCLPSWDLKYIHHCPAFAASSAVCLAMPQAAQAAGWGRSSPFCSWPGEPWLQHLARREPEATCLSTNVGGWPPKRTRYDLLMVGFICLFLESPWFAASCTFHLWWKSVAAIEARKHPACYTWKTFWNKCPLKWEIFTCLTKLKWYFNK